MSAVMPAPVALTLVAAVGLLIGSFLNVVAYRVPLNISVATPRSACPACHHPVRFRDNVPVVSWLVLRGRCRDCSASISWRYPAVEAGTGVLFALVSWRVGWSPLLPALLFVAAAGVVLGLIDADHRRLPFEITLTATAVTALLLGVDAVIDGVRPVGTAAASATLWLAVYGGVWLVTSGRGMGLGDVALSPLLGLVLGWLGWGPSLVGLLCGFLVGAVVGMGLIGIRKVARRSRVPHGPFMLAGAALGMLAGQPLSVAYLEVAGLG